MNLAPAISPNTRAFLRKYWGDSLSGDFGWVVGEVPLPELPGSLVITASTTEWGAIYSRAQETVFHFYPIIPGDTTLAPFRNSWGPTIAFPYPSYYEKHYGFPTTRDIVKSGQIVRDPLEDLQVFCPIPGVLRIDFDGECVDFAFVPTSDGTQRFWAEVVITDPTTIRVEHAPKLDGWWFYTRQGDAWIWWKLAGSDGQI